MSDDITEDTSDERPPKRMPGPDDPDGLTADDIRVKDGFLDFLLAIMTGQKDELEGSFGITLVVGGSVVSGTVIGRKEWIRLFVESVEEAGPEDFANLLGEFWPKIQTRIEEDYDRRDSQNLHAKKRAFIHLKDARIFNGITSEVGLWRGALDDINGWSMGSYTKD